MGDRPLAAVDRRRITRPGVRRAVRWAAGQVRCPGCNRSGSLRWEGGHQASCWQCGQDFDLQPVCELRPHPWGDRPPRWFCTVHPRPIITY